MSAPLLQVLRSRWFVVCVHAALWFFLYATLKNLRGRAPEFQESAAPANQAERQLPVAKLGPLFAPSQVAGAICNPTNAPNPFFTKYFVPPAPPAPTPPTTRKIQVTYLGFYQTADGPKHAVLNVAGGLMVARVGTLVATNVYVASASLGTVVLTNTTARTNILALNAKNEIEVPIR